MFAAIWGCSCAHAQAQQQPAVRCGGETIGRGSAGRILDGRTFVLDDGREVRLAAIEAPSLAAAPQTGDAPGAAAKDALTALIGGDDVLLRRAEFQTDRYGRLLAYVFAVRDGDEIFAQGEMIAAGFARVADHVGTRACATELAGRETAARKAKLGLWGDSYYDVLDADNAGNVLAQRGRFALVEGKVLSVRQSGSTIYVNFGRHWTEDFTVTIRKRNERNFVAAGLDPKRLEGRRIRVRGWIEARGTGGSPWIEAAHPEQIEAAEPN